MSASASAQTRYRGFVEAGYGALVGEKCGSEMGFSTSHGMIFNHVFVGVGLGLNHHSVMNPEYDSEYVRPEELAGEAVFSDIHKFNGVTVPVFLNIKSLWEEKRISPAFDLKAGVGMGFVTGLFSEAGAGCRFRTGSNTAILLSAFFRYGNEAQNSITDDSRYKEGNFSSIGLKAAFEF